MTPGALRVNNSMSCHHVARVNSANEAHLFIYLSIRLFHFFFIHFFRDECSIFIPPPPHFRRHFRWLK